MHLDQTRQDCVHKDSRPEVLNQRMGQAKPFGTFCEAFRRHRFVEWSSLAGKDGGWLQGGIPRNITQLGDQGGLVRT